MDKRHWVWAGCCKLNEWFWVHQIGFLYWDKLGDKKNAWYMAYQANDGKIFSGTYWYNPPAFESEIVLEIPESGYRLIPNVSSLNKVAKNSIPLNENLKDNNMYTSTPMKFIYDNMPEEEPSRTDPDIRYRDCDDWWLDPI